MRTKLMAAAACLLFLLAGCGEAVRLTPGEDTSSGGAGSGVSAGAPSGGREDGKSVLPEDSAAGGETESGDKTVSEAGDETVSGSGEGTAAASGPETEASQSGPSDSPADRTESEASGSAEQPEEEPEERPGGWVSPRVGRSDPVDDEWFADAAFVGNSLTEGFYAWSGVRYGDAYASTSMSVLGVADVDAVTLEDGSAGTILEGLAQKPYGKIYILLGINEISMRPEDFRAAYETLLDRIAEIQPDADIYIEGLSPVTRWKSEQSPYFNMENIRAYNSELYGLAAGRGLYYIDLCEALADEEGYLPDDCDTDGVHFVASYYAKWYEYLKTHTR